MRLGHTVTLEAILQNRQSRQLFFLQSHTGARDSYVVRRTSHSSDGLRSVPSTCIRVLTTAYGTNLRDPTPLLTHIYQNIRLGIFLLPIFEPEISIVHM